MGLFDGYVDPHGFADSGGMLGRLLSLRPDLAQNQRQDVGVDQSAAIPLAPVSPTNSAVSGPTPVAPQPPAPDLHWQYQALRPILGDRDAMLATLDPETGKTPIAQARANQQRDNVGNVVQAGYGLRGIPFPFPPTSVPPPPIPMPAIPEWLKDFGTVLQLYRKGFAGRRSRGDDGENECDKRLREETSRCHARYDEHADSAFSARIGSMGPVF